jgi:hypothetical protein
MFPFLVLFWCGRFRRRQWFLVKASLGNIERINFVSSIWRFFIHKEI